MLTLERGPASTQREGPRRRAGALSAGATSTSEVDAPSTAGNAFDATRRGAPPEDWQQILKWTAAAFPAIEELVDEEEAPAAESDSDGNDSDESNDPEDGKLGTVAPIEVNGDAASSSRSVKAFQTAYNENRSLITGDDSAGEISVDGKVGKQTWGAIFDLYQYNVAQELGESIKGAQNIRKHVQYLDDETKFVGFGEHHPADGNRKDAVESQANRRVEVLLFEEGHEPDVAVLKEAPELSEIYHPDAFRRAEVEGDSAKRVRVPLQLETMAGLRIPGIQFICTTDNGVEKRGTLDANGVGAVKVPPGAGFTVEYLEPDRIRAAAVAAQLAHALDSRDAGATLSALMHSKKEHELILEFLGKYFPREQELEKEILAVARGTDEQTSIEHCIVALELHSDEVEAIAAFVEPSAEGEAVA